MTVTHYAASFIKTCAYCLCHNLPTLIVSVLKMKIQSQKLIRITNIPYFSIKLLFIIVKEIPGADSRLFPDELVTQSILFMLIGIPPKVCSASTKKNASVTNNKVSLLEVVVLSIIKMLHCFSLKITQN